MDRSDDAARFEATVQVKLARLEDDVKELRAAKADANDLQRAFDDIGAVKRLLMGLLTSIIIASVTALFALNQAATTGP